MRTALDSNLQKHADATIENQLREHGPDYNAKQSAMVILDPLGAMRAMVGGRDYGASQFNRATDALRQPGSSFKPFVYLTALMTGKFKPSTIVVDGRFASATGARAITRTLMRAVCPSSRPWRDR